MVDTGAYSSCMSEESFKLHNSTPIKSLCNINVKTASGTNLEPLGITECTFKLGTSSYKQPFIVCRKLTRNFILGQDFLRENQLHIGWTNEGRFRVRSGKNILVEAITIEKDPVVSIKKGIVIPPQTMVVAEVQTIIPELEGPVFYDFLPTERINNQRINLVFIPVLYYTSKSGKQQLL